MKENTIETRPVEQRSDAALFVLLVIILALAGVGAVQNAYRYSEIKSLEIRIKALESKTIITGEPKL